MKTTINDRIQYIIDEIYNGNVSEFCRTSEINRSTLNTILGQRKSKPSFEAIYAIANIIGNQHITWLIKGEGEKPSQKITTQNNKNGNNISGKNRGVFGNNIDLSTTAPFNTQKIINENGVEITRTFEPEEISRLKERIVQLECEVQALNRILEIKDELLISKNEIIELYKNSK